VRLTGDPVVEGTRAFVAERGGAVHAVDLAAVGSSTKAWTAALPKAAARTLAWAAIPPAGGPAGAPQATGVLFALNGSDDVYNDELPLLAALDPRTGASLLQRPIDRPAQLCAGDGLVVVASGGRQSNAGLHVVGVRPNERLDPAAAKLAALRSASEDALFNGQHEVSSVLARAWVRAAGGRERLDDAGLAFVARTLARSNRPDEALDLVHFAEEKAGAAGQPFWDAVRTELGMHVPTPPPPVTESPPATEPKPATEAPKPATEAPKPATEAPKPATEAPQGPAPAPPG
jgi:hypothetical protein